jgi:hypothetical protein
MFGVYKKLDEIDAKVVQKLQMMEFMRMKRSCGYQ